MKLDNPKAKSGTAALEGELKMTKLRNTSFGTRGIVAALAAGAMILTSAPGMAASCNTQGNWRENSAGDYSNSVSLLVRDKISGDSKGQWYGTPQGASNNKFVGPNYLLMATGSYLGKTSADATETLSFSVNQMNASAVIKCTVQFSTRMKWTNYPKQKVNLTRYDSYKCDTSTNKSVDITCTRNWNPDRDKLDVKFTLVDGLKIVPVQPK